MGKKYRNGFFIFGLAVLALMVTQLDFHEAWQGISTAGYWFAAVVVLWAFLYMFNTLSWYIIIHNGLPRKPAVNYCIIESVVKFGVCDARHVIAARSSEEPSHLHRQMYPFGHLTYALRNLFQSGLF